jgi:hypothetical protein
MHSIVVLLLQTQPLRLLQQLSFLPVSTQEEELLTLLLQQDVHTFLKHAAFQLPILIYVCIQQQLVVHYWQQVMTIAEHSRELPGHVSQVETILYS